jgi:hypothetical protein
MMVMMMMMVGRFPIAVIIVFDRVSWRLLRVWGELGLDGGWKRTAPRDDGWMGVVFGL